MGNLDLVMVVGPFRGYDRLLRKLVPDTAIVTIETALDLPTHLGNNILMVYTDGLPIQPTLYDQPEMSMMGGAYNRGRDIREQAIWSRTAACKSLGIGRGSHLMWALSGGSICTIGGHRTNHDVIVERTGEVVEVQSAHTQTVILDTLNADVLAYDDSASVMTYWSRESKVRKSVYAQPNKPLKSVEAWSIPNTLGIQWRPDLTSCPVAGRDLFYKLFREVLLS